MLNAPEWPAAMTAAYHVTSPSFTVFAVAEDDENPSELCIWKLITCVLHRVGIATSSNNAAYWGSTDLITELVLTLPLGRAISLPIFKDIIKKISGLEVIKRKWNSDMFSVELTKYCVSCLLTPCFHFQGLFTSFHPDWESLCLTFHPDSESLSLSHFSKQVNVLWTFHWFWHRYPRCCFRSYICRLV